MNTIHTALKAIFTACLFTFIVSCEGQREVEDTNQITVDADEPQDTLQVVQSGKTAEEQLEEFRTWLNSKASKGDSAIRREWPEVRRELRERNAELERNFENLSAKSKEEYRDLQNRYEEWEEQQDQRQMQPLQQEKVAQWQNQLLNEYSNLNSITAGNIREAYLTFMGTVRTKRHNWSQSDWDYVDYVYSNLNQRRREVEGQIRAGDKLKIRTLQAEYLALEGSADAQSLARGIRNNE